ncbi:MAG: thioesterase family protein [Oscillospiraceae bacterium]|jgi:predicted thioesterase|nr:thioesterase family protein [Oscillospiraceae bacterium]
MNPGIKGIGEVVVTEELTAMRIGSGLLPVYATPMMIALMENTAANSVQPYLEEGQGTVGTRVDVSHLAATPLGMTVRVETELTEIDRRRLVFSVHAFDDAGLIGEGTHERFIVNNEKFMLKANSKKAD